MQADHMVQKTWVCGLCGLDFPNSNLLSRTGLSWLIESDVSHERWLRSWQAWCEHHEVPMEEADFYLGSRLLKSEDTNGS